MPHTHHTDSEMQRCIENCTACHGVCVETISHCLMLGGEHASANHIRLLMDCAEICQLSANFMLRGSGRHEKTCGVCAEICSDCATECERMGKDDETMRRCAEFCRRCAASCEHRSQMPA